MRIIFDENVPWPLRRFFAGHTVTSVQLEGWMDGGRKWGNHSIG